MCVARLSIISLPPYFAYSLHEIIIALFPLVSVFCVSLQSAERLKQSLMYQPLGLISIHSALGKGNELSFLFLRSFLFRIKFWIAWFLSRGSNEELAMPLQNAVLPRCILPSARSLCRSRSPFVFLLLSSLLQNLMSSQPIKFFACCTEECFMKREEYSVDPDVFEEDLVLQLYKLCYELLYYNCIIGEMKPDQQFEDK